MRVCVRACVCARVCAHVCACMCNKYRLCIATDTSGGNICLLKSLISHALGISNLINMSLIFKKMFRVSGRICSYIFYSVSASS